MNNIPYYWISAGRGYWRPNKRMMRFGFCCVALGVAGPDAEQLARIWNGRWQQARKEARDALGGRAVEAGVGAPGYVYFLQIADRIKIGSSRRPFGRLSELAGAAPGRLKRAIIVVGSRVDEKRLHGRFKAYRTGGEWFVASRPLLLTISRCAAAGQIIHDEAEARTDWAQESKVGGMPESKVKTGEPITLCVER